MIEDQEGMVIGKMFGVLVVRNQNGELGYLAAFSGKLADTNNHKLFVPPIYDMLKEDGFYRKGEHLLYEMTAEIESMENAEEYLRLKKNVIDTDVFCKEEMQSFKEQFKANKALRHERREKLDEYSDQKRSEILEELSKQSIKEQFFIKDLTRSHKAKRLFAEKQLLDYTEKIKQLRKKRKELSNSIQNQLFSQYKFLNANGENASVLRLFQHIDNGRPPSGAGECCAPKLLQYAYENRLEPIAMAEFWWGASPASEIRKHKQFYPSCRGKCEPILGHMLQGLNVEDNPMTKNPAEGKELEILYEDDVLLVVNKPAEFLSVPGKIIKDSVLTRMQDYLPNSTGPLLVHRLDMSTSGILLVAKNKEVHAFLQNQFIRRKVEKRYVAILDGELTLQSGIIDLPLRVDLNDRPRQLVCYDYGKPAKTEWELIEVSNGKSKVYFHPITGRTHQLRVHAAHSLGLGMPIIGDDLYGSKSDRLYLHAQQLTFLHPTTKELMTIESSSPF